METSLFNNINIVNLPKDVEIKNNKKNPSTKTENEKDNPLNYSLNKIFTFKNTDEIIDLKILKNGKIAICGHNYLNIYKYNNEKIELQLSIKKENKIISFTQLSNEDIVICYSSIYMEIIKLIDENKYKVIQITKIKEKECEKNGTKFRVVEIKENEFIIIIRDYDKESMKLWKKYNGINYECVTIFKGPLIYNALKLNEKEFTTLEYIHRNTRFKYDPILKFYNSKKYSFITEIKFKCSFFCTPCLKYPYSELLNENMCLINKDLFCVGIKALGIYLIKISTHEIIKEYNDEKEFYFGGIKSIIKYSDNLFLISKIIYDINKDKYNGVIIIFKYEKENMQKLLISSTGDDCYYCYKLNNNMILIYNNRIINFLKLIT